MSAVFLNMNGHSHNESFERIISLVPSITELLCDLGLASKIIGCTKFCVHPEGFKNKISVIGGTKNLNIEKIKGLAPGIIIANKEENSKNDILALKDLCPIILSDIVTINDVVTLIRYLGKVFQRAVEAKSVIYDLKEVLGPAREIKFRVAYLIWRKPYMTIGRETYIHNMLAHFGFDNVFHQERRYPEISVSDLEVIKPDIVFLSSEPFPFRDKHVAELNSQLPGSQVCLVDGEFFSWYGTRQLYLRDYINNLLDHVQSHAA